MGGGLRKVGRNEIRAKCLAGATVASTICTSKIKELFGWQGSVEVQIIRPHRSKHLLTLRQDV